MKTEKEITYAVGLMSGTSLDGIDAALVKIEENEQIDIKLEHFITSPFDEQVKEEILKLCDPRTAKLESLSSMNMLLGQLYAEAVLALLNEAKISKENISFISSHGQTIFHQPTPYAIGNRNVTSTLQIGDISVIAEMTGMTTVGDFRTRDMAVGGQGAPLVPYADYLLLKNRDFGRVLVNIGGISNITILPKDATEEEVLAYDTGPGNMVIDYFANKITNGHESYDINGELAAQGSVQHDWLQHLLQHSYYSIEPPKSTGREMFGKDYAKDLWEEAEKRAISDVDKIATITELTAYTLAREINHYKESSNLLEVLISGGGSNNPTLMKRIRYYLHKQLVLKSTSDYGLESDAKEAMIFALLGYQCLKKRTNNLPTATGANSHVIMGKVAWGKP